MPLSTHCDAYGHNLVLLTGVVTLGTNGDIGTGATDNDCEGFTIALTADEAGRYTCTLSDKYRAIQYAHCVVEGAADAAYTDQKGAVCMLRSVSASGRSALFQLMGVDADGDFADRDAEDSAKLRFMIVASTGSV
jgi:hypothetical protein